MLRIDTGATYCLAGVLFRENRSNRHTIESVSIMFWLKNEISVVKNDPVII